ncbi:MAG: S9 family peptidase, partial [Anaerohalosphaera sp.]|nr:S9 family peptidase [Anaerohalosphaera sp.]
SSIKWSPVGNKMLFVSGGDIYLYELASKKISRLTVTATSERSAEFLPDGSGYMYSADNKIMKVKFGSHLIEQIDPKFPGGESLRGVEISPDGKRIAFVTSKSASSSGGNVNKVDIVNYRNRFMKAREIPRVTADAPQRKSERKIYLYEINDPMLDKSVLKEVYKYTLDEPRDHFGKPEWSEDSKRIVFDTFDQKTAQISILEVSVKDKTKESEKADKADSGEDKKDKESPAEKKDAKAEDKKESGKVDEDLFNNAVMIHKYLHTGGPTTPDMTHPRYLADNRSIVYLSEQTGFRHLHVLDPIYQSTKALTNGHYEVYPFKLSKNRKLMFVTATKEHPSRKEIYRVSLDDGQMTKLSRESGDYTSVAVSPDGNLAMGNYITFGQGRELVYIDSKKKKQTTLTDSHPESTKKLITAVPEIFDYENRHGHKIYGQMFKPDDWSKDDKRPLLIYIYGGPLGLRKMVTDGSYQSSSYFFGYYMAKKNGYVTVTIDPRGNSGYGGTFEKANYDRVGKPQVEDIVDGVKYLIAKHGVDPKRVAIHGWSFGGFQTQMCLYTKPDVFAAGIAGAGPTEWENYNSWYTTGTIGDTKQELEKFSLLPLAKNLKTKLLLVHGMEDSNVLYQDTVRVYRELLKAGKERLVELFLDPTGGHGLGGDVKTFNRFNKYEEFLLRTVGTGKATVKEKAVEEKKVVEPKKETPKNTNAKKNNKTKKERNKKKKEPATDSVAQMVPLVRDLFLANTFGEH